MIQSPFEAANNRNTLTDKELLQRFVQQQDESAFSALVERHGPMVMGACRRVLQHAQDTEDAFQASFLVLARKAPTIQDYQSLAGWLYKVAYRIALRARIRRQQRHTQENKLQAERSRVQVASRTREIDVLVDEEVQRLPEKYRTPVLLCYLQGRTNEEAAHQLHCPTGTVKIRLLRGREMLRKRLIRQGVALSLVGWLCGEIPSAQAAVPTSIMEATTTAACQLRSGFGLTQLGLSTPVLQLTQSWFKRAALAKLKVAAAVLLTLLLLALSDRLAQRARGDTFSDKHRPTPLFRAPFFEDHPPAYPERPPLELVVQHPFKD